MNKRVILLLVVLVSNSCTAQEGPAFCIRDFCIISRDIEDKQRFSIHYEPRPKMAFSGMKITELTTGCPPDDEPPKLIVQRPVGVMSPSEETLPTTRLRAKWTTQYGKSPTGEVCAWKRDGEQIDEKEFWKMIDKPIRGVLLREKPTDWKRITEYSIYLDESVVFIYPGSLLMGIEQAER